MAVSCDETALFRRTTAVEKPGFIGVAAVVGRTMEVD
jgi:hypothetical protein